MYNFLKNMKGGGAGFFDGGMAHTVKKTRSASTARFISQSPHRDQSGMTLVEMLVYTALFVIIAGSVVYTLIALGGAYRSLQSSQAISSSAQVALERMTRDIRSSTSVDLGVSTLGSSPGTLQLNTLDTNGNPTTVRFSVSGDVLRVSEAGVDQGPLTVASAEVTSLVFRRIATLKSEAVKIEMTIGSGEGPAHAEKTFYSTVVLRGSYPAN